MNIRYPIYEGVYRILTIHLIKTKIMRIVLTDKPVMARSIASVLGANEKAEGYLYGNGYAVT